MTLNTTQKARIGVSAVLMVSTLALAITQYSVTTSGERNMIALAEELIPQADATTIETLADEGRGRNSIVCYGLLPETGTLFDSLDEFIASYDQDVSEDAVLAVGQAVNDVDIEKIADIYKEFNDKSLIASTEILLDSVDIGQQMGDPRTNWEAYYSQVVYPLGVAQGAIQQDCAVHNVVR